MFGGTGFIGQQNCASTIVHAAGITRCHRAVWPHHAFELGQGFQTGFAGVLILVHHDGFALFLRDGDGCDFLRQDAGLLRCHGFHLAGQGHAVLGFALYFVVGRHVFCGLRHGVHAVLAFHQGVDEAPADGGVKNLRVAAKRRLGFGHHKRSAAHALHPSRDHQTRFACTYGTGGGAQSIHARATQPVDGGTRNLQRQTRQQTGHVRHIAVVFACLVDAAIQNIGHSLPIHLGITRHQSL